MGPGCQPPNGEGHAAAWPLGRSWAERGNRPNEGRKGGRVLGCGEAGWAERGGEEKLCCGLRPAPRDFSPLTFSFQKHFPTRILCTNYFYAKAKQAKHKICSSMNA